MESNMNISVLECTKVVFEAAQNCECNFEFFNTITNELECLSQYFSVTHKQSMLIAVIFNLSLQDDTNIAAIALHFNSHPIGIFDLQEDIDFLCEKGIFEKGIAQKATRNAFQNEFFLINEKISRAFIQNKPMPELEVEKHTDCIDVLAEIYSYGLQVHNEQITATQLFVKLELIFEKYNTMPFFKAISDLHFEKEDTYLFMYLIYKTLCGFTSVELSIALTGFFQNQAAQVRYVQNIISRRNYLIANDYIDIAELGFADKSSVELTQKTVTMLKEFGFHFFSSPKSRDFTDSSAIPTQPLFYNEAERKQIETITKVLQQDSFTAIQNRLKERGLPKGISMLLYGAPGTGKTETVLQIAKRMNREIYRVDISGAKSMWHGESEKQIKRIFTEYKLYAESQEVKPILLFNEADAIISKRQDVGHSAVSKTENAMQNILLEELENFEGIFFATTNMVQNFDAAFERRFLYKIEFHQPTPEVKAQIWQSKLPRLSESECNSLASRFDFSGGQINNIVRKSEIFEVINGISATFESIIEFCSNELLVKTGGVKIGFMK